jgi:chemotaxis protein histidine kinase CheA
MTVDPFTERLARVRNRFAATLEGKIDDACAAISRLAGTEPTAAAVLAETYRNMHGIVGVGPTVGFPASGQAALKVEDVLRLPQQQQRGLNVNEVTSLTKNLQALREAAARELQSFHSVRL